MNKAIIFINSEKERVLAISPLLGKRVLDIVVSELKRLDIEDIFLIGGKKISISNLKKRNNIYEVKRELGDADKVLLLSPLYPLMTKEDYEAILNVEADASVVLDEDELCSMYALKVNQIDNFENLRYRAIRIKRHAKGIKNMSQLAIFNKLLSRRINNKLLKKGVRLMDTINTYIGPDVSIDANTIIYPGVFIEGRCSIGKNNIIQSGVYIESSIIGDENTIESNVNISCSSIGDACYISQNARVREHSQVLNGVNIGKGSEINNSRLSNGVSVSHLVCLDSAGVDEFAQIGTSAVVVADKNVEKYSTLIGTYAVIGSNATLIAPIRIGDYAVVAAGSTIDQNIDNGDLGIARLYQTNKVGYGYKYHNKGR